MGRILVCDDARFIREYIQGMLLDSGYEVEAVPSPDLAKESMRRESPTCLVLDLHFPGEKTGKELCEEFRAEWPEVPIFVVSGTIDEQGESPIAWGADEVLLKAQLSVWHFLNSIRSCITRARFRQHKHISARIDRLCDDMIHAELLPNHSPECQLAPD